MMYYNNSKVFTLGYLFLGTVLYAESGFRSILP